MATKASGMKPKTDAQIRRRILQGIQKAERKGIKLVHGVTVEELYGRECRCALACLDLETQAIEDLDECGAIAGMTSDETSGFISGFDGADFDPGEYSPGQYGRGYGIGRRVRLDASPVAFNEVFS